MSDKDQKPRHQRRRILWTVAVLVAIVVAIYVSTLFRFING